MLNNVEFAHLNNVPVELSPEMADFAMFTVKLPSGRNLFTVKKHDKNSLNAMRRKTAKEREAERQANLARYIQRGYAFDSRVLTNVRGELIGADENGVDE
jgi:hypothetical protein